MRTVGTITKADQEFVETWENIAAYGNVILRMDARGVERHELIQGRRKFLVTTEERILMSDRVVDKALDPFHNGAFRPVLVPDSVSKETNPNALSDDEIQSIFVSSELAWDEWLKVLDSPDTLTRMMDLAESADITLARYRALQIRLAHVKPRTQIVQKDREQFEAMGRTDAASAARGDRRSGRPETRR